jgi:SAM-dependent methyltransferase
MNGDHFGKTCPLCSNTNSYIYSKNPLQRNYIHCKDCYLIFVDSEFSLSLREQKLRYDHHENNIENKGYIRFLNQAIQPAIPYLASRGVGLDYGSGPNSKIRGSVLSRLLEARGYSMSNYDPIYQSSLDRDRKYDFIFSTEVWEHFTQPAESIYDIVKLLKDSGFLVVMTTAWNEELDFSKWYYAKDDTHVSFYHKRTMDWVGEKYNLKLLENLSEAVWIFRK